MTNSNIYTAYVEEVIEVNGEPSFDLRIRIPQVHGLKGASNIKDIDLPIAKPLLTPGMVVNREAFMKYFEVANTVQVLVKDLNFRTIYYFGLQIRPNDILEGVGGGAELAWLVEL